MGADPNLVSFANEKTPFIQARSISQYSASAWSRFNRPSLTAMQVSQQVRSAAS
jgi:hypothetical protein